MIRMPIIISSLWFIIDNFNDFAAAGERRSIELLKSSLAYCQRYIIKKTEGEIKF